MPLFCGFFLVQNSFAISPSNIYVARSYSATSTTESNYYPQNIIGNVTLPVNLLNVNNTASRTLYGFVVNFPLTGTNSANKYNSIRNISLTLSPPNGNSGVNRNWIWINTSVTATFYFYESSYSNLLGSCSATIIPGASGWNVTEPRVWSCSGLSTENYTPIGFVEIIIGNYNSSYQPNLGIATTTQYDWSGNFTISAISYDSVTTSDPAIGLLNQQINQNQTIIDQNQQIIDQENAAVGNIENQSPDDYSDTENQSTTNIIGVISSFFGQFTNFTPTNCEITLPFPDFLGGDMEQNICSGKDQAGEIISIVGSLIMVGFYIPLAFALLKMIYSEIRSFTNG